MIERDGYLIGEYRLDETGHCLACGTAIPGVFEGPAGEWGPRRQPVVLRRRDARSDES
jgi:pyruvate formate lyase activating enzyme